MKKNYFNLLTRNNNTGLFIAVLILFTVLAITSESYLTILNFYTMGRTISIYGFIALAQAIALAVGNMNLSIGAIGGISTITVGYFLDVLGYPGWIAVFLAIIFCLIAGALNGIIIAKLGINSFLTTLGTLFLYTGIVYGFTEGFPFNNIPKSFTFFGKGNFFGIPYIFILLIVVLVVLFIIFKYIVIGRRILAVGENLEAAKFLGINTGNIIILTHILSGFFASIAGILYVSRIGSANPETGQQWLIISFAVAIIGGTSLSGGSITALGIFLGSLLMVMIKNGLVMLKVNIYWEQAFLGLFILIAVIIDKFRTIYSERRKSIN
jgi:ribose transport system permease protein